MNLIRTFLLFLFSAASLTCWSQQTYPIDINSGLTLETCSGFFVDSGGDTLSVYFPGEDFSVAFCNPDTEPSALMMLEFDFFQLGEGDFMNIYDGENNQAPLLITARNNDLHQSSIYASGNCLFIEFISSPSQQGLGWLAKVNCLQLCDSFFAEIIPEGDTFDHCPDQNQITFIANSGYFPENVDFDPAQVTYQWTIDGISYSGDQVTHTFEQPGAYTVSLTAEDALHGCITTVTELVRIGTLPSFDGTSSAVEESCAGAPFSLNGVVTPTIWTGFPVSVADTAAIPDGTGDLYESSIVFDVFGVGDQIESSDDFNSICLEIEHVAQGDLQFELECPDGSSVVLKDYGNVLANLGEPVVWDNITPGVGYQYCFSSQAQYGTMEETSPLYHEYTDQAGNYYFNAAYLPAGTYTPEESLENLAGCPLNGEWTIRVTDNTQGDDGFMFSWSLLFNDDFYPDSLIFSPQIVEEQWFMGSSPLEGNPATAIVDEAGEVEFTFVATDNFGCSHDTSLVVNILPLPEAEIISELEIPVCEGDSTLLTVVPSGGDDPQHWVYQWMLAGADIPGAVFDTLTVKEPATYTVMVMDTITGCMSFIDISLSTQNCDLTIPNVFTPNGDGINDEFEILNLEYYPMASIVIVNRWGKQVFEHSDYYGNWWDGDNHPAGVYYYVITYSRAGERKQAHGAVTILR